MKGGLPLTFPPELRVLPGVQVHMRALAYGVWAGIVLNTGSTLAPNYDRQASKGYMRARQERRQGTGMPPGRMGVTRPSPYSRGGKSGGDAQNGGCCISQRWGNFKTLLPPPSDPAQGRC